MAVKQTTVRAWVRKTGRFLNLEELSVSGFKESGREDKDWQKADSEATENQSWGQGW